jgi:Xaa-Pro aminopeptidase
LLVCVGLCAAASVAGREREPNSAYTSRRSALVAQLKAPVVLFAYTGRENSSPSYVFAQEENFYYLTGHNEEGAALLLLPADAGDELGAKDTLFLPSRDPAQERWSGPRIGPSDPDVGEKTGFGNVEPYSSLRERLATAAKTYKEFYTLLPHASDTGYPHSREWSNWLRETVPGITLRDASPGLGALRQIKSSSELVLLTKAIELSMDAHLTAMRMMRPGLFEYQVAAKMVEIHAAGGCEGEAYAPIVGTGFNSTILHYNRLDMQIRDGDVVLLDVGGQYAGYAADITRTLPANAKFTPRQREIYEVVLGAQNAVLEALKPGMTLSRVGPNSLHQIAYDYMETHGKDSQGRALGRYFIHGLGHHIGLNVHDVGDPARPLAPGMVVTIEPGLYLQEENLGVRIEDIVLITPTGYKLLTARLPRTVEEIEAAMASR